MIKKAIVTGATGMIGASLIEELLKQDIEVLAICNPNSARLGRVPKSSKIKCLEVPLEELDGIQLKEQYDICFHLAWAATGGGERNAIERQVDNISYTLAAVHMSKRLGCHTFIGGGSQAEYGRIDTALNENTPINPENAYGIAKYSAGRLSGLLAKQLGIRHIWTRILSVYGPGDGENTMIMYMIRELLEGRVPQLTRGEQLWDYIYCEDAARALYLLGEHGKDGKIYCIGSGESRPLKQYMTCIRDSINSDLEINFGAKEYQKQQVMYLKADISDLIKDTGFKREISFEQGIQQTIDYYKKHIKGRKRI